MTMKPRRSLTIESMEDRKLFATDLMGMTEFAPVAPPFGPVRPVEIGEVAEGASESLLAANSFHGSLADLLKPNPEDDGDLGPAGPVIKPQFELEPMAAAKPDPNPDCWHPLVASCDLTAPEQEELAPEPDPNPDCWHPLVASCDLKAPDVDEYFHRGSSIFDNYMPNPEDDDDLGPLGPVAKDVFFSALGIARAKLAVARGLGK